MNKIEIDPQMAELAKHIQNYAWGYWYIIVGIGLVGALFMNEYGAWFNIPVSIITIFVLILGTVKKIRNEDKIVQDLVDIEVRISKQRSNDGE